MLPILTQKRQIFAATVTLLWMVVSVKTMHGVIRGKLFVAPCLAGLQPGGKEDRKEPSAVIQDVSDKV